MVKSSVRVIIRTRPTANFASKNITIDEDKGVSPLISEFISPSLYYFNDCL